MVCNMQLKTFQTIIEQKKRLTPTVLLVRLRLEGKESIIFRAGQHVILQVPANGEVIDRPFSIASSPKDQHHIDIVVRLLQGGLASTFLETSPVNTKVRLLGPKGKFKIRPGQRSICFITAGSGIAPFRSMLFELLDIERTTRAITLFFIISAKKEVFFRRELHRLSKTYSNFRYVILLSNPNHLSYFRKATLDPAADFYLCGGTNFVHDVSKILQEKGINRERIHFEEFK